MSIHYRSTRGQAPRADLRGVTLGGLAPDGGLYVPESWPQFLPSDLAAMKGKSYSDIAYQVLKPFTDGVLADDVLRGLIGKTYAAFDNPAVASLKELDERHYMLELFHGPTLAFEDVALQLLGHIFEYFLALSGERMTVLGATSGDTGSAAIAALTDRRNIDVFILYPKKGPSEIQRRQMTCADARNVHAIAIDGSFDDCQAIVKALFGDAGFREKHKLAAVNSINWLRILAQSVYYFSAAAAFAPLPVSFVVPTGNFGNVYAGYVASKCGLPISKLAIACNKNDSLARFLASGRMKAESVAATLSPSMDIQISSNFERLLFDLCKNDAARLSDYMAAMKAKGEFAVTPVELAEARQIFTAGMAADDLTLKTIRETYEKNGYVLDPHSAVGAAVAKQLSRELPDPVIMLATAHPAKFPETIQKAINQRPTLPGALSQLLQKPERTVVLANDKRAVQSYIEKEI